MLVKWYHKPINILLKGFTQKVILFSFASSGSYLYIRMYIDQGSWSMLDASLHSDISKEAWCWQYRWLKCLSDIEWLRGSTNKPMKRKVDQVPRLVCAGHRVVPVARKRIMNQFWHQVTISPLSTPSSEPVWWTYNIRVPAYLFLQWFAQYTGQLCMQKWPPSL